MELPYDLASSTAQYVSQKMSMHVHTKSLYMRNHNRIIHNSWKVENHQRFYELVSE